jgi:hypothetical protein
VISNAIAAVVEVHDIYKSIQEKKYKETIGEGVMFVGYAMATAAAAGEVMGITAAAISGEALAEITFLGLSTGGWGLLAAAVIAAGALIAYMLRERPLKDWAQQCPFTDKKPFDEDYYSHFVNKADIEKQQQKLFEVLTEFKILPQIRLYSERANHNYRFESFVLTIKQGAFKRDLSRFLISLEVVCDRGLLSKDITVLKIPDLILDKSYFRLDAALDPKAPSADSEAVANENGASGKENKPPSIIRVWNANEIEALGKGKYESEDFKWLCWEFQNKAFSAIDGDGECFLADRQFKLKLKARLDYEGKFDHKDMDKSQAGTAEMLFPIENAFEIKNKEIDVVVGTETP